MSKQRRRPAFDKLRAGSCKKRKDGGTLCGNGAGKHHIKGGLPAAECQYRNGSGKDRDHS